MAKNLNTFLDILKTRLNRGPGLLNSPYLYLDDEGVRYLFQETTGLERPPKVRVLFEQQELGVDLEHTLGPEVPTHLVLEALDPLLTESLPLVNNMDQLDGLSQRYALVEGRLAGTHFPDGELNLEIQFAGLRGILFYTRDYFSSVFRPMLTNDRFHAVDCDVRALVYVHGSVQRQIFYHSTYGDNEEHAWIPLVPVFIQANRIDDPD